MNNNSNWNFQDVSILKYSDQEINIWCMTHARDYLYVSLYMKIIIQVDLIYIVKIAFISSVL